MSKNQNGDARPRSKASSHYKKFSMSYFTSLKLKMQPISKVQYVLFCGGKKDFIVSGAYFSW